MNNSFKYCLLKYQHSQVLEEDINIGILFYFPHKNKFSFIYPNRLTRVKRFYSNFSEGLIKVYLNTIARKVKSLNSQLNSIDVLSLEEFIQKEILISDATALKFSSAYSSVFYSDDIDKILKDYYELYFYYFELENKNIVKHDERFILKKFREVINELDSIFEKQLIKDTVIQSSKTSLKFDYAWQNGSLNLIKALSFDLADNNSINDKAVFCYGTLNLLSEVAVNKNYRFDLFVAKPQKKSLYKAYDNALAIINESEAPHKVIEEGELKTYAINAIEYLSE